MKKRLHRKVESIRPLTLGPAFRSAPHQRETDQRDHRRSEKDVAPAEVLRYQPAEKWRDTPDPPQEPIDQGLTARWRAAPTQ